MIQEDLETAGILTRDANGELATLDEYGLSYDFHGLRHTFATLLNKARVPLATAQRLMRHSDPKLTAKIYTHVMVDAKAEAIDMLPAIAAVPDERKLIPTKIVDRKMDRRGSNLDRQITTYSDAKTAGNSLVFTETGNPENEKAPVSQGKTGALRHGAPERSRTPNLQIRSVTSENVNSNNNKILHRAENDWTGQRTVLSDKPHSESSQTPSTALFSDLAAIVATWPTLPAPIREAVKAVLSPYIIVKDT